MNFWDKILGKRKKQTLLEAVESLKVDAQWIDGFNSQKKGRLQSIEEILKEIKEAYDGHEIVEVDYFYNSYIDKSCSRKKDKLGQLYDEYYATYDPYLLVEIDRLYCELGNILSLSLARTYNFISRYKKICSSLVLKDFKYIQRKLSHFLFKNLDEEDVLNYLLPLSPVLSTNNLKHHEKRISNYRYR